MSKSLCVHMYLMYEKLSMIKNKLYNIKLISILKKCFLFINQLSLNIFKIDANICTNSRYVFIYFSFVFLNCK